MRLVTASGSRFPDRAKALFEKNQAAADARYEHLTKLVDLYK